MKNATNKKTTSKTTLFSALPPRLPLLLMSVFLTLILSTCSFPTFKPRKTLESKPFSGTIINEETGKPIANAVVMMKWPKTGGTFAGSNTIGSIEIAESVTDAEGRYAIAGWLKKGKEEIAAGFIYKVDPNMVIYAPGYWPTERFNNNYNVLPRGEAWKAEWDGEAIGLKPTHRGKWSYEQQQEYLRSIESYMGFYFMPKCSWLKIPNYYLARHRAVRKESYGGHTVLTGFLTTFRRTSEKDCGVDPKAFFLSHGMTNKEFDDCCSGKPHPPQWTTFTFPAEPEVKNASGVKK